jgi:protein-tyrosine-phosphatase
LRRIEDFNEIADTDLLLSHEVEQAKPRPVAERLKESLQIEMRSRSHSDIFALTNPLVKYIVALTNMFKVIFACVHNAGRSQIAAALFNQLADPKQARAISAGTEPAAQVHPAVVDAMRELGVDLSQAKPQRLTPELTTDSQMLVTMGCGDECPYVPGLERDDWPLPDPKGQDIEAVRRIRDEIASRVRNLIQKKNIALSSPAPEIQQ